MPRRPATTSNSLSAVNAGDDLVGRGQTFIIEIFAPIRGDFTNWTDKFDRFEHFALIEILQKHITHVEHLFGVQPPFIPLHVDHVKPAQLFGIHQLQRQLDVK